MKLTTRWIVLLIGIPAGLLLLVSGYVAVGRQISSNKNAAIAEEDVPIPKVITADGRLEPKDGVIDVGPPFSLESPRVEHLKVKRGDIVKTDDVVAVLASHDIMKTALLNAQARQKTAQAELERVLAGAKIGEVDAQRAQVLRLEAELNGQVKTQEARIATLKFQLNGEQTAQEATIQRFEAELETAQRECERYVTLKADGAVSLSRMESVCLEESTTRQQLAEAKANLVRIVDGQGEEIREAEKNLDRTVATIGRQIEEMSATLDATSEVRSVDVKVAKAELAAAQAAVAQAQINLDLTSVKSSIDGRVLDILAWPGELAGNVIVKLGQTDQMYALAEVYETDVRWVDVGQSAQVTTPAFEQTLQGVVEEIGWQVGGKDIANDDPVIAADARVVKVWIRLDEASSAIASKLTHHKVDIAIER